MKPNFKIFLWLAGIVVGAGIIFAGVEASSITGFCALCHSGKAGNTQALEWEVSTHALPDKSFNPKQQDVGCAECHIPRDIPGFITTKLNGVKDAIYWFSQDTGPAKRRYQPNILPDETCLSCHKSTIESAELTSYELDALKRPKLGQIGLRFDHRVHMTVANQVCSECHSSKENYFARNYLSCSTCHKSIAHGDLAHAEGEPALPSAERCAVCHTGRLHVVGYERLQKMADISRRGEGEWGPQFFESTCPLTPTDRAEWWKNPRLASGDNCRFCHPAIEAFVWSNQAQPVIPAEPTSNELVLGVK